MNTLLQFPSGGERTLDEWKEAESLAPQASAPVSHEHDQDQPDPFVEWEARRGFMTLIGHLGFESTQP